VKLRLVSKAPLAHAGFLAVPLFFASLMAASLAIEKPHLYQWRSAGRLLTTWHPPTTQRELAIWALALVPPLLLLGVGVLGSLVPYGFYAVPLAAILDTVAVDHRLSTWAAHHTARFRNGVDLIPVTDPASDKVDPGEWEAHARETALSLSHYTIGLALAALGIALVLEGRRRRARPAGIAESADELDTGGAPQMVGPG
jgi:hypothetical protein